MDPRRVARAALGAIARPRAALGALARPWLEQPAPPPPPPPPPIEDHARVELAIMSAARAVAASGDHRGFLPTEVGRPTDLRRVRIGFVGNIANNACNFVRCLRRLGYDAELLVEDGGLDAAVMNRPFWEDVTAECDSYEEALTHEAGWAQPSHVRRVAFDQALLDRFAGRLGVIDEVRALWKAAMGTELPVDRALLLAQRMGHWPLLLAMRRYDVVQLSGAHMMLGPLSPRPHVVFPTGSDLFTVPFEESLLGLLVRAGYRRASHVLFCGTHYPPYLERLQLAAPCTFAPMMVDTDTYSPGEAEEVRRAWREKIGGSRFIVSVCRQSWTWKGNDRLLRGFAALPPEVRREWRLVLLRWGQDIEKSEALVRELGLQDRVLWERLCSKPALRLRQRAADVVSDAFVVEGYGTSVLESMAAGKPVLMTPQPESVCRLLPSPPPVFGGATPDAIRDAILEATDDRRRAALGAESRAWVERVHGHAAVAETYLGAYRSVLGIGDGVSATTARPR